MGDLILSNVGQHTAVSHVGAQPTETCADGVCTVGPLPCWLHPSVAGFSCNAGVSCVRVPCNILFLFICGCGTEQLSYPPWCALSCAVANAAAAAAAVFLCVMLALCPCRRIAVEVFDASCFCTNQQQPLGESVMRIQLLNACGWQVRGGVCGGGGGRSELVKHVGMPCALSTAQRMWLAGKRARIGGGSGGVVCVVGGWAREDNRTPPGGYRVYNALSCSMHVVGR